jgi:hypothetical protein
LKKVVRGVRPIERTVEDRTDEAARVVQGGFKFRSEHPPHFVT